MKELSLNILDITENSVKAGATLTTISIEEIDDKLILTITDNGCGMTDEVLKTVLNPFYTTRTTRKVGMGLPLLKLAAEQTGGSLEISSKHIDKFLKQFLHLQFHTDLKYLWQFPKSRHSSADKYLK